MLGPTLETGRLLLRPPEIADLDAWAEMMADDDTAEGARAAMNWAFEHLGWTDVIHCVDPRNQNSIALAQRLGSTHRGTGKLPPPFGTAVEIYGQTRQEWRKR